LFKFSNFFYLLFLGFLMVNALCSSHFSRFLGLLDFFFKDLPSFSFNLLLFGGNFAHFFLRFLGLLLFVLSCNFLDLIDIGFSFLSSLLNMFLTFLLANTNLFEIILKTSFSLLLTLLSSLLDFVDFLGYLSCNLNLLIKCLRS